MYNNLHGFKPFGEMDERRATRDVEFDCKSDMKSFTPRREFVVSLFFCYIPGW